MSRIKKALTATMSLTIMLFGFIIFLLYVIYCYAYYDKYLEFEYTNKVNNHEYNFVYDKMVGKGKLTFEQFTSVIDKMNNKDKLVNIFETYYKDSGMYNKESFLDTYFYNIDNVVEEDIKFSVNGQTNLFTRRAIFYDEIKISNKNSSTNLGIFNKIMFKVESNSILRVNNKELTCLNDVCTIDKMYGGIHEISYISNGYEYYGLVNITKDKQSISVTNLDSLVKAKELNINLKYGRYILTDCSGICPVFDKSYLIINEDNTYYIHTTYSKGALVNKTGEYSMIDKYITLDNNDTYIISGNNLVGEGNNFIYTYND